MATSKRKVITRYYVRDSVVPFEEDHLHEFKGHRNLTVEELPPSTQVSFRQDRASRRACSRNINAFLNTGDGGTLYLGVLDDGTVKGFQLTQYQKDHVQASLDDLMSRYSPPVAAHRYKVHFVPVVDKNMSEESILQHCAYESSLVDMSDQETRRRPHRLRISDFCWCDKDAAAQNSAGRISSSYVIEIHVKAWDMGDYRNLESAVTDTTIHPIHEDEEGNAFFRRQASIVTYTMRELAQMTRQEVRKVYSPKISRLKSDIEKCIQKLKKQQTQA